MDSIKAKMSKIKQNSLQKNKINKTFHLKISLVQKFKMSSVNFLNNFTIYLLRSINLQNAFVVFSTHTF